MQKWVSEEVKIPTDYVLLRTDADKQNNCNYVNVRRLNDLEKDFGGAKGQIKFTGNYADIISFLYVNDK